jgi:hypothetical protein
MTGLAFSHFVSAFTGDGSEGGPGGPKDESDQVGCFRLRHNTNHEHIAVFKTHGIYKPEKGSGIHFRKTCRNQRLPTAYCSLMTAFSILLSLV